MPIGSHPNSRKNLKRGNSVNSLHGGRKPIHFRQWCRDLFDRPDGRQRVEEQWDAGKLPPQMVKYLSDIAGYGGDQTKVSVQDGVTRIVEVTLSHGSADAAD